MFLASEFTNTRTTYKEIESRPPNDDEHETEGKQNCVTSSDTAASANPISSEATNRTCKIPINEEKSQTSNNENVEFTQEKLMR